mmetsp:Transcript_83888/g.139989  ORF Transcript_83888/g.139989 Transcript_83888/m.139989 type:complete len:241 (+) Transcript_83888:399-1121(+)
MPKANATAIHVSDGAVQAQILLTGKVLGCKGLVQLYEVIIVDFGALHGHQVIDRGHRTAPHCLGCTATHGNTCDLGQGLDAKLVGFLSGHQQHGRRSIIHPRCVPCGNTAPLWNECRGQARQPINREVRAEMLIAINNDLLLLLLVADGHNLVCKAALLSCRLSTVVAADCQLILFLTCDTILAGDEFRSQTHDVWLATEFLLWAVQRVGDKVRAHMQPTNKCINALTILKPGAPSSTWQ